MFERIRNWWRARKEVKDQTSYDAGFGYCMTELMKQRCTVQDMHNQLTLAYAFGAPTPFERGVDDALARYELIVSSLQQGQVATKALNGKMKHLDKRVSVYPKDTNIDSFSTVLGPYAILLDDGIIDREDVRDQLKNSFQSFLGCECDVVLWDEEAKVQVNKNYH